MIERNFIRLFSILYRKNMMYLNDVLKKLDINTAQMHIILYLSQNSGVSQEHITAYFLKDKASIARTVDSLIKKGLVIREKNKDDKRAYQLSLTDEAIEKNESIINVLKQWNDFIGYGISDEELDITFSCLNKITEKLDVKSLEQWRKEHE